MQVEISIGELFDKLTILEIKMEKIKNNSQLENIRKEWDTLNDKSMSILSIFADQLLFKKIYKLEEINRQLWDIEDWIRECEKQERFDKEFVELARSVYKLNDKRSKIKRDINLITKSNIIEEKSYS
tara:strand:- start:269 stop:649 length:381 start_codon:yes stop_codon:yes gene_type:complete